MPSLKLISATDTEYSAAVLKSLNEQRINGLFCDITIIIREKKFRAHKTILSASSTYFYQLFTVAGQVVELNFIKAEVFEEILNYIYTSKIIRVRSDKLEELIQAGKILGVKFIANLASPLSQVKGLPGLSKEPENKSDTSSEAMPIITESFSISSEEFNQTSKPEVEDEDSDGDVMFVSQTTTKKISTEVIDLESSENINKAQPKADEKAGLQKSFSVKPPHPKGSDTTLNGNSKVLSSPETKTSTGFNRNATDVSSPPEKMDSLRAPIKQVTSASAQQGDLKLKLINVPNISERQGQSNTTKETKQTITKMAEDVGSIGSVSPDCKVYANIGENTYDIVKVKDDPEEGGSKSHNGKRAYMASLTKVCDETPESLSNGPLKKSKTDDSQYYELIMDGKTFYVCVVCKRPYVCVTSLRRHFNTHSWEKKYPCHHCNKVFALAEYRTKHEIVAHTGERRYQCLLCSEMFINYQVLASHSKSVHNVDASGRRGKDPDNDLYRLLPSKTVKMKAYSWASEDTPEDSSGNITAAQQESDQKKMLNWDDIFMEPDSNSQPEDADDQEPEFEYILPDTY
ncbi:unnamed protein product [Knipowitschia caucasica]